MTVLQALDRYYGRMARQEAVAAPGWSYEPIGVVLELDEDGTLLGVEFRLDSRGKPRPARVPKWFSRQGTGSTPNFLWDNAAYVLGLGGTKNPGKTARDHAAFKALHLKELADETDPGLLALRRFLERWSPDKGLPPVLSEKQLTINIGFRLRGDEQLLTDRPAADPHVARLSSAEASDVEGFCLVRGERLPLVRLHPKIKGVDGAASAEIPLVSFNVDAFTSYGKEQGFNAPTSRIAAFRYGAALNALLRRDGRHRLHIADATVAFWADASAHEQSELLARAAEEATFSLFEEERSTEETPLDDGDFTYLVEQALRKVAKGRAEAGVDPALVDGVGFHVLGLAPNIARIAVRYWISDTFGQFRRALDSHARAVAIQPSPWGNRAPAIQRLLVKTTALQEKFDNIPDGLAGDVTRAVLTGTPYPRTWLAATVIRLRAGDAPSGWHAAAIKACLSRMQHEETPPVSLDENNPHDAYHLGRLFAVLEAAQYAALGRVNASIADRYYGAASSTPARVFGPLMRNARTHISDARKRGRGLWIEPRLQQIINCLNPELPHTLRLEDQGRFAVGYYHERAHRPARAEAEVEEATSDNQGEE